jgi:ketosteroid isomerase-like protein
MMTTQLPTIAAEYVRSINTPDADALVGLFAPDALVSDAGREFRGVAAIRAWSESDIFTPQVRLKVLSVAGGDGEAVVTTEVDGNFDRTGLPDPVVIDHHISTHSGKIARLTCRLH